MKPHMHNGCWSLRWYKGPHLSHHAIPCPINLLAMFAVGDQIEIVGEFYTLCNLLEDVDAETFATAFDVNPWISCMITDRQYKKGEVVDYWKQNFQSCASASPNKQRVNSKVRQSKLIKKVVLKWIIYKEASQCSSSGIARVYFLYLETCRRSLKEGQSKYSPEFELLAAGYCVPHACAAERVHILHDDKRRLLQSNDGQVVIPLLRSRVQLESRPHVVPHRQWTSLPLANLHERVGGQPCDLQATVIDTLLPSLQKGG